jgi:hypothetical protein
MRSGNGRRHRRRRTGRSAVPGRFAAVRQRDRPELAGVWCLDPRRLARRDQRALRDEHAGVRPSSAVGTSGVPRPGGHRGQQACRLAGAYEWRAGLSRPGDRRAELVGLGSAGCRRPSRRRRLTHPRSPGARPRSGGDTSRRAAAGSEAAGARSRLGNHRGRRRATRAIPPPDRRLTAGALSL